MREKIFIWIAWHMPKELVKWAAVRMMATASAHEKYKDTTASELTCFDALEVW